MQYSYNKTNISAIKEAISESRFSTYLDAAKGDEKLAFELYLYNARLAKSFLFPLGVTEIVVRNAIDEVLVQFYGDDWYEDSGQNEFRSSVLTEQSTASLDKAIERANSQNRGKIIAELTFDFWSNLFRQDYADFWRDKTTLAFPNLSPHDGRKAIQKLVRSINLLRNRVAHHEPIFDMDLTGLQSKMIKLIELRCPLTANWMKHHATINVAIRSKPTPEGIRVVLLSERADKRFQEVIPNSNLALIAGSEFLAFVCRDQNTILGVFTHKHIAKYVADEASKDAGMIDLSEHTVSDILGSDEVQKGWIPLPMETEFLEAVKHLKKPKQWIIVAIDSLSGAPVGVVLRAHRRY